MVMKSEVASRISFFSSRSFNDEAVHYFDHFALKCKIEDLIATFV